MISRSGTILGAGRKAFRLSVVGTPLLVLEHPISKRWSTSLGTSRKPLQDGRFHLTSPPLPSLATPFFSFGAIANRKLNLNLIGQFYPNEHSYYLIATLPGLLLCFSSPTRAFTTFFRGLIRGMLAYFVDPLSPHSFVIFAPVMMNLILFFPPCVHRSPRFGTLTPSACQSCVVPRACRNRNCTLPRGLRHLRHYAAMHTVIVPVASHSRLVPTE